MTQHDWSEAAENYRLAQEAGQIIMAQYLGLSDTDIPQGWSLRHDAGNPYWAFHLINPCPEILQIYGDLDPIQGRIDYTVIFPWRDFIHMIIHFGQASC